jgi:hypothetical protein
MEAGLANHVWTVEELVGLLADNHEVLVFKAQENPPASGSLAFRMLCAETPQRYV